MPRKKVVYLFIFINLSAGIFFAALTIYGDSNDCDMRLTILYTGEMNGYLEQCGCSKEQLGGLTKRGAIIEKIQTETEHLLILDNGNIISEPGWQSEIKYQVALTALKEMGYHALNVGHADLSMNVNMLIQAEKASTIPFLCSNVTMEGQLVFAPFILHSCQTSTSNVKVAIIGILSSEFEPEIQRVNPNLKVTDPFLALVSTLKLIPNDVSIIIVLCDMNLNEATTLAESFSMLDIIICSSRGNNASMEVVQARKSLILQPGMAGEYLGRLDIKLNRYQQIAEYKHQMIPLSKDLKDSPVISQILAMYQKILEIERVSRQSKPKPRRLFTGSESCRSCHSYEYSIWADSKHAYAYSTLVERKHQFDPECLGCHTTGFQSTSGFTNYDQSPNLAYVGCESCHGPGMSHVHRPEAGYGEVMPQSCYSCHTIEKSPHFSYVKYFRKISH